MLLSIIIPTHNRSYTLGQSLKDYYAILAKCAGEHCFDFEIIIVNDASTDETKTICDELNNNIPNVNALHLGNNVGPGPARNEGLKIANGEYVWFLDDDDQLKTEELDEVFRNIILKPDVITHSLNKSHNSKQELINAILKFQEKQEIFNCIIKRQIIIKNNISFGDYLHEDISFLVKVVHCSQSIINLNAKIIKKNITAGAITNHMSEKRIDGYAKSYKDVVENIELLGVTQAQIHTSYLGVMLYLIQQTANNEALRLIKYLREQEFVKTTVSERPQYNRKSTNFEYASIVFLKNLSHGPQHILDKVKEVFASYLSCKDLENSLFLAPNEIRACCKRFFVDGNQKGDVVLLPADEKITYDDIVNAKEALISEINAGTSSDCAGCPYIERYAVKSNINTIDYISFENFSYCNMRCTYCSPKYYGGTEAKYDSLKITDELLNTPNGTSDNVHVVFGGGEPTLSPKFLEINRILKDHPNISKVRLLSNSLKYNKNVPSLLQNSKYQLVTSIDAGTQKMFKEIRKRGEIEDVLSNLQKYASELDDKQRLTIKYIVTSQNYDTSELISFVELLKKYDLMSSLFQISCDFSVESPKNEMILACYHLSSLLYKAGAAHVFFDDLIRDRVKITDELAAIIRTKIDISERLNDLSENTFYVLWGAGLQARWILRNTFIGRKGYIKGIVSDEVELVELINKKSLDISDMKIIPAGVQSTYEIIQNIKLAGYGEQINKSILL